MDGVDEEIDCFGTYEEGHEECMDCDEIIECKNQTKIKNPYWKEGGKYGVIFGIGYAMVLFLFPSDGSLFWPIFPFLLIFGFLVQPFGDLGYLLIPILCCGIVGICLGDLYQHWESRKNVFWPVSKGMFVILGYIVLFIISFVYFILHAN